MSERRHWQCRSLLVVRIYINKFILWISVVPSCCIKLNNSFQCTYCGWKKSCTNLDGWNPINNGIHHLSTGAGFFPSIQYVVRFIHRAFSCLNAHFWLTYVLSNSWTNMEPQTIPYPTITSSFGSISAGLHWLHSHGHNMQLHHAGTSQQWEEQADNEVDDHRCTPAGNRI